ncbi:MAG: glutamate--tRNA ligase [Acidimicrobiales bacterium]|nr:glutamate--tRNA ligase [Acidimicrobiales bacterium]
MTVRVRFSPAPTGYLHVGGARAALFNWLYARHTGGTFILRIEDTDTDRSADHLVDAIYDSMRWLGLDWDEEYRQSDRADQHLAFANRLLDEGQAYRCDCTRDALDARIAERGDAPGSGYDGFCRDRTVPPGDGVVVRFRTPDDGVTGWDDVIRGRVDFDNAVLEDFIIVRSNGTPMFHVANAYDDADMGITHVVRGEDLVNTTPRVLLLREAMGYPEPPVYAHLPLIVNEQRKKLSKRRDDVAVGDYRANGYLPDAMRNYLITLGWGPRDGEEIAPIERFIEQFELSDINNSPAFFDVKKLQHFNAEYIRALPIEEFVELTVDLRPEGVSKELYERMAPFVQQRLRVLSAAEIAPLMEWMVGPAPEPPARDWKKVMGKDGVSEVLRLVSDRLASVDWTPEKLEQTVFGVGEELNAKTQLPVRMAVTGSRTGMPLFEPMAELDRDEVVARLRAAIEKLGE